jgi:phosphoglucomutase
MHPSAVRDPLHTVLALVKLLSVRRNGDVPGLFEIWCGGSGQPYTEEFTLADVIASLPVFRTTGSYTPDAALHVQTADHAALKERYQAVFEREWAARKTELAERYGITSWEASCSNGLREKRALRNFGEAGRGGLKLTFADKTGNATAWIWMRGSGTEPVFRVMADAAGGGTERSAAETQASLLERDLIDWQRRMVLEADGASDVTN